MEKIIKRLVPSLLRSEYISRKTKEELQWKDSVVKKMKVMLAIGLLTERMRKQFSVTCSIVLPLSSVYLSKL